ncbi:GNAT family N-acetyltransferase [Xenophilus sp. Marseille-Q4582]|uniref:GNAT family N-acetyltransferase n=1 Tax=Xenophilus sp. Marseille-Q4582 TaxID=2866600 RepID=UPI001CE481DA|nr:GNAT family N-acetyltransferase [Xenophilus sp. Marseille-Q4582]
MLTLEAARQIMREVLNGDDRSISPSVVPAEPWGHYLVQCEAIDQVLPELARHHAAYHAEVNADGPPLDYDYPRLLDIWRAGRAFLVTARADGAMVASLLVFVGQRIDTRTAITQDDRFWIDPEHRGGMLAVRVWRFVERVVLALGIREGWIESRDANGAGRMAEFMGYRRVATKYVKTAAQDACGPERSKP